MEDTRHDERGIVNEEQQKEFIPLEQHEVLWFYLSHGDIGCPLLKVESYDGDENNQTAQAIIDFLKDSQHSDERDELFSGMTVDWYGRSDERTLVISHDTDGAHMAWTIHVDVNAKYMLDPYKWAEGHLYGINPHEAESLLMHTKSKLGAWTGFYRCLLAHLQTHVEDMQTPYDATRCVEGFCARMGVDLVEAKRRQLRPNVRTMLANAKRQAKKTSTGIPQLDSILCGGFQRGGIYVIAGDPAAGKTALAVQCALFASNQCKDNERAAYYMLDQGGEAEIVKRCVSLAHAITAGMDGRPSEGLELSRCDSWTDAETDEGIAEYDALADGKLIVSDVCDLDTIMRELDRLYDARLRPRMLVIDYYQLLTIDAVAVASDAETASDAMCRLRTWSYQSGACVLLCGQYSKAAIERHQKEDQPRMTDLLGGVDVPYQAEGVLCITKAVDGSGSITITDAKGRHSGNMAQGDRATTLTLDGEHGLIA